MDKFLQDLDRYAPLDKEAKEELADHFKKRTIPKNGFLLGPGEVCSYFYLIETGLVKSYSFQNDKEFVMAFFAEDMLFTELNSYLSGIPSKYLLIALEDTTCHLIHKQVIDSLCQRYHSMETWVRRLYESTSVCFMDRISEMLEENAKERYHRFVASHPGLMQRISLGEIANYIGITQVSLSRIRAQK